MIDAWWIIPTFLVGCMFGIFLAALLMAGGNSNDEQH